MSYLNSFLSNLSQVLTSEEVRQLEYSMLMEFEREEDCWNYLTIQNQKYILGKLNLPLDFPIYPWAGDMRIMRLIGNAGEYQQTLLRAWQNLDLTYEETLEVAKEGCLWADDNGYWDFLLTFSKGYVIDILKGDIISQKELDVLTNLNFQYPYICRELAGDCDDIHYISSLLKQRVRIVNYFKKIEGFFGEPSDSIYLGVELETLYYTSLEVESLFSYNGDRAILKADSSIQGQGFEIVTAAMSLDYQLDYWEELIEKFGKELTPHSSCGMHVHVSRAPLSQLQIGKILVFLNDPVNAGWVNLIAGRLPNEYCDRKPKKLEDVSCPQSRHEALNLTNDSTIEFRIFSSTNKYEEIASRIEFCHALTKYCENAELTKLQWADFKQWVIEKDYSYYSHLKEWLINQSDQSID